MQLKLMDGLGPELIVGIALQRFDLPIVDKKDKSCAVLKIIYIRPYATNLNVVSSGSFGISSGIEKRVKNPTPVIFRSLTRKAGIWLRRVRYLSDSPESLSGNIKRDYKAF